MPDIKHRINTSICRIRGHDEEYTDEYEKWDGYVRADAVCQRCDRRRLAWTGPKADKLRDSGFDIPEEPRFQPCLNVDD